MKALDKLQESYKKELDLAKKHKERADELKKRIDEQKALALQRKTQELQLTHEQYEKFLDFLSDRESVISVLSAEEVTEILSGTQKNEEGDDVIEED